MQKSYECEVATHIGPESCGAARKSSVEALTGERAGRVFSRVSSFLRDADAIRRSGRPLRAELTERMRKRSRHAAVEGMTGQQQRRGGWVSEKGGVVAVGGEGREMRAGRTGGM